MIINNFIHHLQEVVLANISPRVQLKDEFLINTINEGVMHLHSIFNISLEHAIIKVPPYRHTFKIASDDPDVMMAARRKSAKNQLVSSLKSRGEILYLGSDTSLANDPMIGPYKDLFGCGKDKALQILEVEDTEKIKYKLNEENVFALTQDTLYFTSLQEGTLIYVTYKPMPEQLCDKDDKWREKTIDLPEGLMECLYAFIALKVVNSIEGYKQFYPNLLQSFNKTIQDARDNQVLIPDGLEPTLNLKKGFY